MTDDKKWCVYEHISPSGKRYFGITSQNPKSRWGIDGKKYLQKNINGEYTQPAMANALLKYPNWNEWKHYILLQHETFEYACKAEQCLIKSYKTMDKNYGYNCTGGGEGTVGIHRYGKDNPNYGRHLSKEAKESISFKNSNINSAKSIPIYCMELDRIFWGCREPEYLGISDHSYISKCCRGLYKSSGEHPVTGERLHWMFAKDAVEQKYITQERLDEYISSLNTKDEFKGEDNYGTLEEE